MIVKNRGLGHLIYDVQVPVVTEVVVDDAMFVDSRAESNAPQGGAYVPDAYAQTPSFSSNAAQTPNFEELNTDDDLPF